MKVRIVHSAFELKGNERGMVIPCVNTINTFLGVSKETDDYIETSQCPICGKKIYLEASGWMGHY